MNVFVLAQEIMNGGSSLAGALPSVIAALVTLALLVSLGAHVAHATNHKAVADDLDIAKEALDVGAAFAAQVAAGKPPLEALRALSGSDEAQDLWKRSVAFMGLIGQVEPPKAGASGGGGGAVVKIGAMAAIALSLVACSVTEFKADAAIASSDAHAGLLMLAGAAAAAAQDPAALAEAQVLGGAVLKKAGVPASTASRITGAITSGNAAELQAAALEGAAVTSAVATAASK